MSLPSPESRRSEAFNIRKNAANAARNRTPDPQENNGEEMLFNNTLIGSFTKGLRHNDSSLIMNTDHFDAFKMAANTGDINLIRKLPLGPPKDSQNNFIWRSNEAKTGSADKGPVGVRGWESMAAGLSYELQGPDAQTFVAPPAPKIDSDELVAEMAEVYLLALARDVPISRLNENNELISFAIAELNKFPWFNTPSPPNSTPAEAARRRGLVTTGNIFRGLLPGSLVGPYLSQFLITGSDQIGTTNGSQSGIIQYGAITIDQRVRVATKGKDFMTEFDYFLDVQDGADLTGRETYDENPRRTRLITTLRDLATYVHFDALYEAYLNATLIMLRNKVPYDDGLPFIGNDAIDKQQGFALYGGPHILTLVTEVATRALKAVRFSKFNIHRRTRPEAIGGLIHVHKTGTQISGVSKLAKDLDPILQRVASHNRELNGSKSSDSFLLPMAFSEGSPMHPSYGSGHATVAGACVTILKAFFKEDHVLEYVFEVNEADDSLTKMPNTKMLTVRGELEKLADNISIGRDIAGVHYFSDQWESLILGEKIAIGLLEEQRLTYNEKFQFSLTKFNGKSLKV